MMASIRVKALARDLTLPSLKSLHLASNSVLVLARLTPAASPLWVQRENRSEPITQVMGSSRDGSIYRSIVNTVRCSAPGWYPWRVERSLAGRPRLASQVNRACSRVSGYLASTAPQSWQSGVV